MDDLVRSGKIRHYGFSGAPAWYVARAQTLAEKEGKELLIALQLEYSLVERSIEREHVPAAQELGIAICPWSQLAGGFLSGKYKRGSSASQGRLDEGKDFFYRSFWLTERNWLVLDALCEVAQQLNKKPAQIAVNWVATKPGATSTIIGVTKLAQLDDNLSVIEFSIPAELRARLEEATALQAVQPYLMFGQTTQLKLGGGVPLQAWAPARVTGGPAADAKTQRQSEFHNPFLEPVDLASVLRALRRDIVW